MIDVMGYRYVAADLGRAVMDQDNVEASRLVHDAVYQMTDARVRAVLHILAAHHQWRGRAEDAVEIRELVAGYRAHLLILALAAEQEQRRTRSHAEHDQARCPGCAAVVGSLHERECAYEVCGKCGGLRIGCVCDSRERHYLMDDLYEDARRTLPSLGIPLR